MAYSFVIPATAIILLLICVSPSPTAGYVKDAFGEMVQNSKLYFIISPYAFGGIGITWTPNNSSSCPIFVKSIRFILGTPVWINTQKRPTFVPTSFPVFLTFVTINTPCTETLHWLVTSGEAKAKDDKFYVTAGTSQPFVSGEFRIEEANTWLNEYNIKFCHSYESSSIMLECDYVGFLENGLLGITPNEPVAFRFRQAFSDDL